MKEWKQQTLAIVTVYLSKALYTRRNENTRHWLSLQCIYLQLYTHEGMKTTDTGNRYSVAIYSFIHTKEWKQQTLAIVTVYLSTALYTWRNENNRHWISLQCIYLQLYTHEGMKTTETWLSLQCIYLELYTHEGMKTTETWLSLQCIYLQLYTHEGMKTTDTGYRYSVSIYSFIHMKEWKQQTLAIVTVYLSTALYTWRKENNRHWLSLQCIYLQLYTHEGMKTPDTGYRYSVSIYSFIHMKEWKQQTLAIVTVYLSTALYTWRNENNRHWLSLQCIYLKLYTHEGMKTTDTGYHYSVSI